MSDNESLDDILPEYESISKAPATIEEAFAKHKVPYDINREDYILRLERTIKYKSLMKDGNVYLIENPLSREEVCRGGRYFIIMQKPELVGELSALLKKEGLTPRAKKNKIYGEY